jgi:hypothetical protein
VQQRGSRVRSDLPRRRCAVCCALPHRLSQKAKSRDESDARRRCPDSTTPPLCRFLIRSWSCAANSWR